MPLAVLRHVVTGCRPMKEKTTGGARHLINMLTAARQSGQLEPQHFTGDAAGVPLKFLEVLDIFLLSGLGGVEVGRPFPLGRDKELVNLLPAGFAHECFNP